MDQRHRKVLHAVFIEPVCTTLRLRDVLHLLVVVDAVVDSNGTNRIVATLDGRTIVLARDPLMMMSPDEVRRVRDLLVACGIDPKDFPV